MALPDYTTQDATTYKAAIDSFAANTRELKSITATVAADALTCGLAADYLYFRSSTLTSGTSVLREFSSALSLVVPSGATLGTVSGVQSRLILLAIDNAGTVELAIVNQSGGNDLSETGVISTTAIDATADSANVIYSTTARSSVAYRVVGYIESTQATAGTWATSPTVLQGAGGNAQVKINSGHSVQIVAMSDGTLSTGTGTIPADDTIPQNTEGNEFMTLAVTPKSVTNLLKIDVVINLGANVVDSIIIAALFRDAASNAVTAHVLSHSQIDQVSGTLSFSYIEEAGTASSVTYKVRAGALSGTTSFNGSSGVRDLGGVGLSSMTITEYAQ